jgi:hypothetical protein
MNATTAIAGGLAGAASITLLHESLKRIVPEAPRMDRLGMQAISKGLKKAGKKVPDSDTLFTAAMIGDLLSNAIYYSTAAIGKEENVWKRSAALGLAAGLGAVLLPKPLGLNEKHSNRTIATQLMTVGLYVTGAVVTTAVMQLLKKKKQVKNTEWERRLVTSAMG